jgi:hypothetical protein
MESNFVKIVLGIAAGFLLCLHTIEPKAQTYPMTDARGYNMGTVQINGNTAQFVNPMGYTTQTATIYPNQIVITTPQGYATSVVGNAGYTVPSSPSTPPSPRVLQ